MTCNCTQDIQDFTGVAPYTQCPNCARKHLNLAWVAWQELGHQDDNRDYCSANLRLCAEHLRSIYPDLANEARGIAIRIEDNETETTLTEIEDLRAKLKAVNLPAIPLLIPYRLDESYEGKGDELRILLRSIERNVIGISKVVLIADKTPDWLDTTAKGLTVVPVGNPYRHCKDANLFLKMKKGLEALNLKEGKWAFSADDSAFMQRCDIRLLPVIYNGSSRQKFEADKDKNKWHRRMANTFDYLESMGINMAYSYDCHLPQVFNVDTITEKIDNVPWNEGDGYCIYTLWRGLEGVTTEGTPQHRMTNHFSGTEGVMDRPLLDKMFVNYSDDPFGAGLRERLFTVFNQPSKWERKS